ncbi:MAG: serine/threonine-protein kinase [bacterium]
MERFLKSRYRIGEKISENPFSVTYKGLFISNGKPVIIKIYKRGTLNSRLINQMKQKVRQLSAINHHGIAKLIDGDYGWQGFYYVREYIEGHSLGELLAGKRQLEVEKALDIVVEVCRALEVVHQQGIIHGGIKPTNIFIDSQGLVRVSDFIIEGEIKEAMPQKVFSLMMNGRYLAPEELTGVAASVSADIYALGLVLLEMVEPALGFKDEGLKGGLLKLKKNWLLSSEKFLALPRYLQSIISRALEKDLLLRFPAVNYFRESLEQKRLVLPPLAQEELVDIFENTVTRYGQVEIIEETEGLEDVGQVKIRWGSEKHRTWILGIVLTLALFSGLFYAFLAGR